MNIRNFDKRPAKSIEADRNAMVTEICRETKSMAAYTGRDELDSRVIQALETVPRHLFVEKTQRRSAYVNLPLPIRCEQTISQPFIVALMTDLLDLSKESIVLEVGTGSGYQAAVLSELSKKVYTIETFEELAHTAEDKLAQLGYGNVEVFIGNGYNGLEAYAPYSHIIVTAFAKEVPRSLVDQLDKGGRMVIPVARSYGAQSLLLIKKSALGELKSRDILPVRFVPLLNN